MGCHAMRIVKNKVTLRRKDGVEFKAGTMFEVLQHTNGKYNLCEICKSDSGDYIGNTITSVAECRVTDPVSMSVADVLAELDKR